MVVSDDFVVIWSFLQIYNSRSSSIRNNATSPSCSSSSLRVKMIKWTWKNQLWDTRMFFPSRTNPPFCTIFWEIQPQKICHTPRTPCSSRTARRCSITLPIFTRPVVRYAYKFLIRSWLRSTSVLDWQLPSTVYQNWGEVEPQEFREDYSGWTSDKETKRL